MSLNVISFSFIYHSILSLYQISLNLVQIRVLLRVDIIICVCVLYLYFFYIISYLNYNIFVLYHIFYYIFMLFISYNHILYYKIDFTSKTHEWTQEKTVHYLIFIPFIYKPTMTNSDMANQLHGLLHNFIGIHNC